MVIKGTCIYCGWGSMPLDRDDSLCFPEYDCLTEAEDQVWGPEATQLWWDAWDDSFLTNGGYLFLRISP